MKSDDVLMDDSHSLIHTSSSGPPDKHFFQYYKIIRIYHNQVFGTGSHKNFPVLISLLDSELHDDVQSTGNDIAFANSTTWLDHEVEFFKQDYSSTQAKLVAWVRIPSLSTSEDTIIYLYYGNASMNPRENPEGVWNSNYKGVWHLSENPSDSSPQFQDRTLNNNDGTAYGGMTSDDQISGQIDGSIDFDGSDDYISLGSSINIASSSFSVSTWAKRGSSSSADIIFQQGPPGQNTGFHAGFRSNGLFTFAFWADDLDTAQSYNDTNWHHWVCTYDASTKSRKIYRDGVNIASNTASNHFLGSGTFYLGYDGMVNEGFDGQLDESRILNVALSSEWINTSYINQNDPESFYSIGNGKKVSELPNAHYFRYYKEIIIDYSMVSGLNDLLNFPVLISIMDSDLHDDVQSTGNDIAFANSTAWLAHEIEIFDQTYNSTHAQLIAWVRIPSLSPSKYTVITMYYGNSTMSSRQNPTGVWDSKYLAIHHMEESPAGTLYDSTNNNEDLSTQGSMTSGDLIDAQIGNGIDFDNNNDGALSSTTISVNRFTISAWINSDTMEQWDCFFNLGNLDDVFRWIGLQSGVFTADDGSTYNFGLTLSTGKWYHLLVTYDGSILRGYINGSFQYSYSSLGWGQITDRFQIGAFAVDHFYNLYDFFDGTIDEVRILNTALSANWIQTEFKNQYDPNSFYSIGKEYIVSGDPPNDYYFKFHKEITIDHLMVSGSLDLLKFPFLISILDTDLHDDVQQSNGNDIAFAYKGAWLDHEIESFNQAYNDTHAQLIAWVCIPRLSPSIDTVIRIYYGNSTMGSRENSVGVWDPNYKAIWHLSEDPTGTIYDSTANNKDGTSSGSMTSNDQVLGKINGAIDFDGTDDTISFGSWSSPTDFNPSSGTISFWITRQFLDSISENKMVLQIRASGINRIMFRYDGGDYEWRFHHEGNDIQTVKYAPAAEIPRLEWIYVVQTWDVSSDFIRGYINGSLFGSNSGLAHPIDGSYNIYLASDMNGGEYFYGSIDEVRFSDIYRTDQWIETEYKNQNDPQSFLTLGPEESFDVTSPTYSNLIESSDPLELGETEIITIDVFDPSGINQVKIEFGGTDHSMTNIGGNTWQYDSWKPSSVGNYSYTIWMQDNSNNWNASVGTIEVIDTTPPTYSDLIESADPLQLGQNETITIKVYDSPGSGVNQVLLEYGYSNHTMSFIGGNTWTWTKWNASLGFHTYTIFMRDMENNWNITSGTITVVETTAPIIENLIKSEEPLELGNNITIFVDVFDEETNVSTVIIELDNVNYTMDYTGGNTYEYTWTRSWVGTVIFVIYANDSLDNWNSFSGSFDIVDTRAPVIENLIKIDDPLELGNLVIISVNCTDLSDINQAIIEYEDIYHTISNHTMSNIDGDIWQYDSWTPGPSTGNWPFTIWVEDIYNNWASISDSILVQDTTPPNYSDLTESEKIVELGNQLAISINATDLANIKIVSIEYEDLNHTMTNIGGDIWQYNSWVPRSIGNYTYTIYITDNNDNLNYVESSILFQDTKVPVYSNLFESADPLELGDNPIVRIDVFDFAGINQTFIEFEGANHSMINIYGNTWQYDLWTPNNWIVYQYMIHMEDKSGNWNSLKTNITVQDTSPPSPPVLTNSPSGDVSGILVFDWSDGIDPSGISYYILIIDNETNPLATPGYVYIFNITNIGSESSYCELPEILSPGKYYFFLAQVDGVGQQGSYTMGSFTVILVENGTPDNNMFLIIGIILASVIGSLTAIVLVRRKLKKEIIPSRKKIPFRIISSHIKKLSSTQFTLLEKEIQTMTDEKEIAVQINEIKHMGEELFAEGAYLEAQKQFMIGRDLLINLGKEEEAKLFSDLISGIEGLIEEREKRLEILEQVKDEGDSVKIYENFFDVIKISKKLRDPDTASFYQLELIQFFQTNKLKLIYLEEYRNVLEQKADSLLNDNQFEIAAQIYGKCENISQLLVQTGKEEEIANIQEFKRKKEECLNNLK